jgi:hypothetical protein
MADNNIVSPMAKFLPSFGAKTYKSNVGRNISSAGIPAEVKISFADHDIKPVSGIR